MSAPAAGPPASPRRALFWQLAISLFFLNSFFLVSRILDPLGTRFRILAVLLVLFGIALVASAQGARVLEI